MRRILFKRGERTFGRPTSSWVRYAHYLTDLPRGLPVQPHWKDTMDELIDSVGFNHSNDLIVRTPITRKEIAFQCGHILKGTMGTFASLKFLFDDAKTLENRFTTPGRIPKTIVFVNSRKDAANSRIFMNQYLQALHPTKYNHAKKTMLDEFRKPDSRIQVVFATEAIGMGVDIPDVRRVVLYGFPAPKKDLSIVLQRCGRAARDGKPGECILLFEEWAKGPRNTRPPVNRRGETTLQHLHLDLTMRTNPMLILVRIILPKRLRQGVELSYLYISRSS
ncbi:P-loop containing nucleoside triphosphate hydrolase protein [Zopfia rhizophila CBS 207.26]|uniref:DNA 3'-5' helicase n=1 Tax=Zopfia rhizophila CBS 207.26 TaxID=1314779 RepID=A0A6A6D7S6_9PEZI|nr:P-loop containing nucleoside triphosphate hydrolase protein [Zopfia rhizophila CBS 207.26]